MKRDAHQTLIFKELYLHGLGGIHPSIELPPADEFSCSDDEVREVCDEFMDVETMDASS